ncbi:MAG TPA: glycosyltransferase family 39 protein, partial [Anaerolineales bacterium]|nr:glycosyltransferase family 39 protein [Anaerolineales bacterium]
MLPIPDLSRRLPAFTSFLVLGTLVVLLSNLSSPSDPENSILFGFSLERILLSGGLLVLTLTLLFLTLKLLRTPKISAQLWVSFTQRGWVGDLTFLLAIFIFSIASITLVMPAYRLGGLAAYSDRLSSLLVWLAIVSAVGCAIIFLERRASLNPSMRISRRTLVLSASVLGGFLLFGLIVRVTGIGYQYPGQYWYGAGVPMTGLQILFACGVGAFFLLHEHKIVEKAWLDIFVFIALWFIAGWLWMNIPVSPNYFLPDTADNVLYPYSDGATFDIGGQYALIGQGLFNSKYFDRVLYSSFSAYLHLLFGQDYVLLLTAQAAIYAVFPAIVYLLGKELHSRAFGVFAGVLIAVRGMNAITTSKWIDVASPKMMLTDFPTAIGVAIFLLFFVKWWQQPNKTTMLIWLGAVFGLAVMIRSHVVTLLLIVMFFVLLRLEWNWKKFVLA